MQIHIEDVMFPILEMHTNTKHEQGGERAGTQLQYAQQLQKLEGEGTRYGLMVSVRTDTTNSRNPPYNFLVEAYAIIQAKESTLEAAAESAHVLENCLPIIMGSIREQVANMTARAPWGRFLINATPLPAPATITVI